jgi:hypothetical protein
MDLYLLLTAIGLMPGDSVYEDYTFKKETASTSHETAQYIARIFTVQYKHRNIHSTIQVHEHYRTQETENQKNTENTKKHRKY